MQLMLVETYHPRLLMIKVENGRKRFRCGVRVGKDITGRESVGVGR